MECKESFKAGMLAERNWVISFIKDGLKEIKEHYDIHRNREYIQGLVYVLNALDERGIEE